MKSNMSPSKNCVGFSLVEMSVVLIILGFVLAALLLPLRAQREQLFRSQTENTLEIARKALLGFAQSRGRLPCPATANGIENPVGGGTCASAVGFLPAATLGIQPTDANGFAIDGWNNRIMYAVTQNSAVTVPATPATPDFTSNIADDAATPLVNEADGMNVVGIANLAPDLRVCADSTVANCSATKYLINNAVAVIFSTGPTAAAGSGGADEDEDLDGDTVFVSQTPTVTAGNEFDHLVVWLSPYVLYNAMVETGQLH